MSFSRASGILLHPTSLPSQFGIGDLGESAYKFVDFLEASGQKLWQILPLGPTGYEYSPYTMNFSAFAGNHLLISLEKLVKQGLLQAEELAPFPPEDNPQRVNFGRVITYKTRILKLSNQRWQKSLKGLGKLAFEEFCQEQSFWLDDYVLFMTMLELHNGDSWNNWDKKLACRQSNDLKLVAEKYQETIAYHKFLQFIFFQQWSQLREYANSKNIKIVGDISIYVCHNSADVWANPEIFQLNRQTLNPAYIAGVPPDYFSATGQLWGNPVYDWEKLKESNFAWWIERFNSTLKYVDIIRVDHFRGFEAYWRVPAGEKTAINGEWVSAPGFEFFETLSNLLGKLPVMVEDLGIITPEVERLRDHFDFPSMRVLQIAFSSNADNLHLPHNYTHNSVVYTGTHDNETTLGWWQEFSSLESKEHAANYLGYDSPEKIESISWEFIRLALSSVADLAIIPLQDVLNLDNQGRINDPSTNKGNWRWRYTSSSLLTPQLSQKLLKMTKLYDR
ncbi:4-alpha-glucanotransferase (amylomaltase) [Richelia intracellularis HH01]|uniref:4-alpha-glucanotransferase n=1 Tax=Richelia intracellularis HH01 TaxID=1165094 RepID=M1X2L8_9NOST|nr:4-alpha-glucanotransferase [Richelia intracellularis]CCH67050.1 4-alpha-glucanotransferase (amylomaltase) [Richelia intracellularis HH01]HAE05562.1 4-alpha-glucanotransferase [Richelia sp.]